MIPITKKDKFIKKVRKRMNILEKLGLVRISKIEKLLNECELNHQSQSGKINEFYFDCGASSVINYLRNRLREEIRHT